MRRSAVAAPFDDAGYLHVADRIQRLLDVRWSERDGRYRPGADLTETMVNANLLLVHAVAAQRGHTGPARNDRRARSIVRWLVDSPIWTERKPLANKQAHAPGWVAETGGWQQHLVIDAEVVDGLTHAFRARRALDLPSRSVRLITDRIHRLAAGPYWRWPTIRLNQFNWHLLVFAGDATVSGHRETLARGAAAHLERFTGGVGPKGLAAGNLGPGMHFRYLPHERSEHPMNVDSAEYANIVLSFSRFYEQARAAGMPRPAARRLRLLREWVRRAVAGDWTHGGYANWDTGLGFERWHQTKKLALMQQALIGVAATEELQPSREWGAWTKWLLDRSLAWYDAETAVAGRLPDPVAFGVDVMPQSDADAALAGTRIAANAARAVAAGLGDGARGPSSGAVRLRPRHGPPGRHDPELQHRDHAVNQRAFPYGGRRSRPSARRPRPRRGERRRPGARLLRHGRAGQRRPRRPRVAAGSGGPGPHRLAAAPGQGARGRRREPPRRAGARVRRAVHRPRRDGLGPGQGHDDDEPLPLHARAIEGRWSLAGRPPAAARVDALFPSTGPGAQVIVQLRDERRVRLGSEAIALAEVAHVDVHSARGGYRVTPLERPAGSAVRLVATRPQPSAPTPGPTAAVSLPTATGGHIGFAARITPFA